MAGAPGAPGEAGGEMDGLLKLVYQVDRALDAIAQQFPGVAGGIDTVKASLQDVIATATRSGAAPPEKRGLSAMGRGSSASPGGVL